MLKGHVRYEIHILSTSDMHFIIVGPTNKSLSIYQCITKFAIYMKTMRFMVADECRKAESMKLPVPLNKC